MKTKILTLFLTLGILVFTSCNNDENSEFESTKMNFTEIGKGVLYGNGQEGISQSNVIISNVNDWQSNNFKCK